MAGRKRKEASATRCQMVFPLLPTQGQYFSFTLSLNISIYVYRRPNSDLSFSTLTMENEMNTVCVVVDTTKRGCNETPSDPEKELLIILIVSLSN